MSIEFWNTNSPVFCRTGRPTSLRETFQRYKQLRRQKYDLLVALRNDWRTVCFALLRITPKRLDRSALQVANKLGARQFTGTHETTRNLDVLRKAGIPTSIQTTTFSVTAEDEKWASDFLETLHIDRERPLIAIHPGSPIPIKRWMPERYAELIDWLIARKRAQILFVGVEDEIPIITEIQGLMRAETNNIAGKTNLTQLASILQICNVFIGNDSGPDDTSRRSRRHSDNRTLRSRRSYSLWPRRNDVPDDSTQNGLSAVSGNNLPIWKRWMHVQNPSCRRNSDP